MDQKIYYLKRGVQFYDQKHVFIIVDDYIKRWVLILWAVKFLPHHTRVTEETSNILHQHTWLLLYVITS